MLWGGIEVPPEYTPILTPSSSNLSASVISLTPMVDSDMLVSGVDDTDEEDFAEPKNRHEDAYASLEDLKEAQL